MDTREIRAQQLTQSKFKCFGKVIGRPRRRKPTTSRKDLKAWLNISDFFDLYEKGSMGYLEIFHQQSFSLNALERHLTCAEAFIPLEGISIVVVGASTGQTKGIDEKKITAFLLDGSCGIIMPRGVWHWAPLAVTNKATFILLANSDLIEINDIDVKTISPISLIY